MVPVLCVMKNSNYYKLKQQYELELYDKDRNAYTYNDNKMIIAHPPCSQWSRLKSFSKYDQHEKELAIYCYELVKKYGGILEHPNGSSFFNYINASRKNIIKVNQSWWGFPCKKETLLYTSNVDLLPTPLSFDCSLKKVADLHSSQRSLMTTSFCQYLIESVINTKK